MEATPIYNVFAETARKYGRKTAVTFLGTTYSYEKLASMSARFAGGLSRLGLQPGDRVIMYIPNSIQFVVAWLGLQRLGAVPVPITPIYTSFDLQYVAQDTGARAVICQDRNYGYVKRAMPGTQIEHVVTTNVMDLLPSWKQVFGFLADKAPKGKVEKAPFVHSFRSLLQGVEYAGTGKSSEDIAEILYTGGTTKHPKGVPINPRLFLVSAEEQLNVRNALFPKEKDVIIGGAPLFHVLGQTCSLSTVLFGGTLVLFPRVNLDAIFDAIQRNRATSLIGVPAFYRMILEHVRVDQYDLSSLKYCFSAGDVLPVEVANRWRGRFNLPVYQGYGATETCGGVIMSPTDQENPPLSMGMTMPSKRVKVVDALTLAETTDGAPGELLVSSDLMVKAYWNKPEETAEAFVQIEGRLWYRTSDIVRRDENGFFYFVDRTVDTIKHKGYRISASEIEAVLQEHPAVIESCVIGIPDAKFGERIKAFVVLKKDVKGITGYELTKYCRSRLIEYKIPQYIEFRDMLPKSKVGKLLRREIRGEEKKRLETG